VARPDERAGEAETRQRQEALSRASTDADWVLQLDADEVLPDWQALLETMELADPTEMVAIEWPMRVLFRRLARDRYLEVVTAGGMPQYEYPAPIAVRPYSNLVDGRRTHGAFLRAIVRGDRYSTQLQIPRTSVEERHELLEPNQAIWHNSWARSPKHIRTKIRSWGHNQGLRSWVYYYVKWLPAPLTWRILRDFHPLYPSLWPRLGLHTVLPVDLDERDRRDASDEER
jgi:hypothetical protein